MQDTCNDRILLCFESHLPNSEGMELEKALCAMLSERRFFMPSIKVGIFPLMSLDEISNSCRLAIKVHSGSKIPSKSLLATFKDSAEKKPLA